MPRKTTVNNGLRGRASPLLAARTLSRRLEQLRGCHLDPENLRTHGGLRAELPWMTAHQGYQDFAASTGAGAAAPTGPEGSRSKFTAFFCSSNAFMKAAPA